MRKQKVSPQFNAAAQKQCTNCGVYKELSNYHRYKNGYKHFCKLCVKNYDANEYDPKRVFATKKIGELTHCRRCEKYLPKSSFWSKNTYCKKCQDTIGHINNLKGFGLTRDQYIELEKSQNGLCAICKKPENNRKRLSIDHDHSCCPTTKNNKQTCGKCIRGLICFRCNAALGMINDDVKILNSMISYLSKK